MTVMTLQHNHFHELFIIISMNCFTKKSTASIDLTYQNKSTSSGTSLLDNVTSCRLHLNYTHLHCKVQVKVII